MKGCWVAGAEDGLRAPSAGSWQPLLAGGTGAIQAMSYFACPQSEVAHHALWSS